MASGVLLLLAVVGAPRGAGAQLRGVRFPVATVGDTTLTFSPGKERWLRRGMTGIAVDPKKRDDLVARFRVVRVELTTGVTAVVTGQTTKLTTEHVVVIEEPAPRWYRRKAFWGGLLLGAALGATAGSQF
jgi:hypothetical protein